MSRRRSRGGLALGIPLLALATVGVAGVAWGLGEDPAAEVTAAVRALGPPGIVWGRLAVEEESPAGPWTPLVGIEVTLYPATPSLLTELERIRQSARTSGTQYESAVGRVQEALAVHQGRVDQQTEPTARAPLVAEPPLLKAPRPAPAPAPAPAKDPPTAAKGARPGATGVPAGPRGASGPGSASESRSEPSHPWRQKTDPTGLFVFDTVPSGDWLVVAIRIAPYAAEKLRAEPKARQPGRGQRFLPRATGPAKAAEMWVTRVRVVAAERVGLELTDRARWLVGPVR